MPEHAGGGPMAKREAVTECRHANTYPDYAVPLGCMCGAMEYHCRDCGRYFTDCRCGEEAGESGWSYARAKAERRRKEVARGKA